MQHTEITAEDVKKWFAILTGKGEEEMKKAILEKQTKVIGSGDEGKYDDRQMCLYAFNFASRFTKKFLNGEGVSFNEVRQDFKKWKERNTSETQSSQPIDEEKDLELERNELQEICWEQQSEIEYLKSQIRQLEEVPKPIDEEVEEKKSVYVPCEGCDTSCEHWRPFFCDKP